MKARIRPAIDQDLPRLQDIEIAAGQAFRAVGMESIADDAPPSWADLKGYQGDGRAWVALDDADNPVAYLLLEILGSAAHIEQVSVHPDHARQGLGRRLIEHAAACARARGLVALTLTTFEHVPWNAPYYARLGFRTVPAAEWSEELRAVVAAERQHGLDAWPRVVMRRRLPAS
ncbi:GNAT family N-acetyltransferase [Zhihengliuella sp.]|uniref:GNAT family N-acetyltransferase n=1 Tax=Zhihengliuella sp. TaxID=1954483 RepID=UPI0028123487|nr:GNAT family N-acetyltransferase [Zhihengliuella sp.]